MLKSERVVLRNRKCADLLNMSLSTVPIRISSPKTEGILQVSKWLKVQLLIDAAEMHDLLLVLQPLHCVVVSEPVKSEEAVIAVSAFEEKYAHYVSLLQQGHVPRTEDFRRYFSSALTTTLDAFYALSAGGEKYLIKPIKPVVQLQAHHFYYSDLDGKFHSMVLSEESITWGIQFSYPQLFQDPHTRQIVKVTDAPAFPNSALFSKLMKWMRNNTLPTPFEVNGARINCPIRIGKKSLSWIKSHPQLKKRGMIVSSL